MMDRTPATNETESIASFVTVTMERIGIFQPRIQGTLEGTKNPTVVRPETSRAAV